MVTTKTSPLIELKRRVLKSEYYYRKKGQRKAWHQELIMAIETANFSQDHDTVDFCSSDDKRMKLLRKVKQLNGLCTKGEIDIKEFYWRSVIYTKYLFDGGRSE